MPTEKYFQPINISVQIGGYVSTYCAEEDFPYPSNLLSEDERVQMKAMWAMFIGAHPVEILDQISLRPLVETMRRLDDGAGFGGPHLHVISNKFADPAFSEKFEKSVRRFLNKELPRALAEITNIAFLGAVLAACRARGIKCGDARKLKDALKGKGRPKPPFSEETLEFLKDRSPEMFDAPKTLIDRLIKTKRGLKPGAKKTPKAFRKRGRHPQINNAQEFFDDLDRKINSSGEGYSSRRAIALMFGISADALDDLRKKTFMDGRGWGQVIKDARKKSSGQMGE